jgi:NADH-quinone oxidoreductase subunit A
MNQLLLDYLPLVIFITVALGIGLALLLVPFMVAYKAPDRGFTAFGDLGLYGYWSVIVFLGVLTVGFIYEWRKGALEWD